MMFIPVPVLNEPVVLPIFAAVADSQHTMVELSAAAAGLLVHSAFVELETGMAGVDGDRDGTNWGYSWLEGIFVSWADICVAGVSSTNVRSAETATAILESQGPNDQKLWSQYFRIRCNINWSA